MSFKKKNYQGFLCSGGSKGKSISFPFPAWRGHLCSLASSSIFKADSDATQSVSMLLTSFSDFSASLFLKKSIY